MSNDGSGHEELDRNSMQVCHVHAFSQTRVKDRLSESTFNLDRQAGSMRNATVMQLSR